MSLEEMLEVAEHVLDEKHHAEARLYDDQIQEYVDALKYAKKNNQFLHALTNAQEDVDYGQTNGTFVIEALHELKKSLDMFTKDDVNMIDSVINEIHYMSVEMEEY